MSVRFQLQKAEYITTGFNREVFIVWHYVACPFIESAEEKTKTKKQVELSESHTMELGPPIRYYNL